MKIIAVMSPKGGIGKTTTADSIAYILGEEHGKKVLVIDGDSQGDTSKTFGRYEEEGGSELGKLLEDHVSVGGVFHTSELIWKTDYPNIDIIMGNSYLARTDMRLIISQEEKPIMSQEENPIMRLKEALAEVENEYDYCICDCGRLFDMVVGNILIASELVIAPVKVGGFEREAIESLCDQVIDLRVREMNPELRLKGLMTMRQKNKTSIEFEEDFRTKSGIEMFETPVRRSIIAEKATIEMKPLPVFSKRGIVTQDYRSIVQELLEEMEG